MHGVWVEDLKGDEEDDQADVFKIIEKRPNTGVLLKVDEAMKSCAIIFF